MHLLPYRYRVNTEPDNDNVHGVETCSLKILNSIRPVYRPKPSLYFFYVAQKPKWCLGCLGVEVPRSHTFGSTHTHPVGPPWTGDQHVAEALPKQTHKKYNGRKSTTSAKFESPIPAIEPLPLRPHGHRDLQVYTGWQQKKTRWQSSNKLTTTSHSTLFSDLFLLAR